MKVIETQVFEFNELNDAAKEKARAWYREACADDSFGAECVMDDAMKATKAQNLAELYKVNPARACRLALRRTAEVPARERLQEVNGLLGLYGVKGVRGEWVGGYWADIVLGYVNAGDTYAVTVCEVPDKWGGHRFFVGSWGDWVEKHGEKAGVQ